MSNEWNEFRKIHAGKGWSLRKMSYAYHREKKKRRREKMKEWQRLLKKASSHPRYRHRSGPKKGKPNYKKLVEDYRSAKKNPVSALQNPNPKKTWIAIAAIAVGGYWLWSRSQSGISKAKAKKLVRSHVESLDPSVPDLGMTATKSGDEWIVAVAGLGIFTVTASGDVIEPAL